MKNFSANQTLSVGVRMRPCEGESFKDQGNLCLQVIIDRKPDRIPLGIRWPLDKFNQITGELLPRHKNDQLCSDYNLEIGQSMSMANEIAVNVRLSKSFITHEEFKFRFKNYMSKDSFILYMERKALQRLKMGEVKPSSYIRTKTNIERLRGFSVEESEEVTFATLSKGLLIRYRNYLISKKKLAHNSAVGSIKSIKTYCGTAKKDGYRFDEDILDVKSKYQPGRKVGLNPDEVKLFKDELKSAHLSKLERECLIKWLFMIYTGLRISDANQLNSRHINNGELNILQFKVRDDGKRVIFKLPTYAQELIKGRKGLIFKEVGDSLFNKTIKRLANQIGITKTVSAHVARFTFAIYLYNASGDLKAVSELLGHNSIRTTEIYLQIDDVQRKSVMLHLEEL